MNANELMLGNYVKFGGTILIVFEIYATGFYANNIKNLDESLKSAWTKINPIPLTEKWFLDFGYLVISESSAGFRYGFVINHIFSSDLNFVLCKNTKDAGKFFRGDLQLKYVHQLQNLHFALTGNPLQLVEPK